MKSDELLHKVTTTILVFLVLGVFIYVAMTAGSLPIIYRTPDNEITGCNVGGKDIFDISICSTHSKGRCYNEYVSYK